MDAINSVGSAFAGSANGIGLFIAGAVVATIAIAPLIIYALVGWSREVRAQAHTQQHLTAALDYIIEIQAVDCAPQLLAEGVRHQAQWRANNAKRSAK